MSQNPEENMARKPQKRSYVVRLFVESKDDLSLLEFFIDLAAVLMMTKIALILKVAQSSESREHYFFAFAYFGLSVLAVVLIKVFIITPYKIIKDLDEKYQIELEKNRLKFKLSCNKDIKGCMVPSLDGSARFFRLCVEADCAEPIKNCRGHLIKIEKDGEVVFDHDTIDLPFAKAEEPDSLAKTLSPKLVQYVDILCIPNPIHVVRIASKQYPPALDEKRNYVFAREGIYILTIGVSGDGVKTATAKLRFNWTGNEMTSTIDKINE